MTPRVTFLATVCMLLSAPLACAQQIAEVTDGGVVSGYVSAGGITRLSFTGDAAASSPLRQGGAGPGFSLVHEAATGDLYVTLARDPADGERAGAVSFFVTTRAGFTYQVELAARDVPSTQIEVRNPELALRLAEKAIASAPLDARIATLTRAMWAGSLADGFAVDLQSGRERAFGSVRVKVLATYRGPDMTGRVLSVRNPSPGEVEVTEDQFLIPDVLAVALKGPRRLAARESTLVLVIDRSAEAGAP